MRNLKTSLKVEKVKESQYGGGNICIDSTGRYLFSILGTTLNVIDVNTGETVHKLESEEEEITSVCLSPDDRHLITAHRNLLLKQWDNWRVETNVYQEEKKSVEVTTKCTRTWKALHVAPILHMCFDDTSTLLATASSDYTIKVWDTKAQYCTHNLKGAQGLIRCVKFYPKIEEKQQLISGCDDGKIRVYNLNTSKMDACLEGHYSAVTCFEYISSDGQVYDRLLSSSRDKVLILWDLNTLGKIRTIPVYESVESFVLASQIANEPDQAMDRYLITMGNEGLLKLWDTKSGKVLHKQNEKDSLKILNKRKSSKESEELETVIVQGFYNKTINSLVLLTADELVVFVKIDSALISSLSQSETSNYDSLFQVYKQYVGDHGEILDLQYCNKDQNLIAMATNSEFLKVYDLNTWDCRLLKGHTDLVISVTAFIDNENESYLASSSKDSTIRVWRIVKEENETYTFDCVSVCQGHTQDVGALCFSNMALTYLVSGSIDTTVKLWKISGVRGKKKKTTTDSSEEFKMNVAFTIKAHEKDINSISVSPNDKLIATGSSDKSAKIWDSTDGACLAILNGHKRGVWSVEFSPIDQLLATSSADGTIRLWSLTDFDCIKTLEGHNTSVLKVHFLNNGTQLISTGSDGLIKLWNIKANDCVGTFDEHDDKAWALCVNKDEMRFVSGGADGKLVVWRDITEELYEEELEKREEILLKEQELDNCVQQKRWKKALALAILLDKPYKCYNIIKAILQQPDSETNKCKEDLEQTLVKMREDQIKSLLKYATNWNTNTKFCHLAQTVFELIFKNFPPQFFLDESSRELVSKTLAEFVPYTERHVNRVNKLMQQVMLIDYIWQNMKLSDNSS